MTLIINLFGGPCSGKSTTASGLFHQMKLEGINCEYVQEFAKDLTWANNREALTCQAYVFGQQLWRIERLINKVDFIITDSPLLLSSIYKPSNYPEVFDKFVVDMYNKYTNVNIYLNRKKKYVRAGRNQSEEEARKIDFILKEFLTDNAISFVEIDGTKEAVQNILDSLRIIDGRKGSRESQV